MVEQAIITETRAAEMTIKLIAMPNLIPTVTAFDSSIDELKYQAFISRTLFIQRRHIENSRIKREQAKPVPSDGRHTRLITVSPKRSMKNCALKVFSFDKLKFPLDLKYESAYG